VILIKKEILIDFFNELIIKQDYFECHEILEEAWKEKGNFTKEDVEVFLILIVTGEYHYRRDNLIGATTSYKRALKLYESNHYHFDHLGFEDSFIDDIYKRFYKLSEKPFEPMQFPVKDWVYQDLYDLYEDEFDSYSQFTISILANVVRNKHITDKHRLRDRSDVVEARLQALKNKIK
jgi:hypothetical protein